MPNCVLGNREKDAEITFVSIWVHLGFPSRARQHLFLLCTAVSWVSGYYALSFSKEQWRSKNAKDNRRLTPWFAPEFIKGLTNIMQETNTQSLRLGVSIQPSMRIVKPAILMDKHPYKGGIKSLLETTQPECHVTVGERADFWECHLPQTQCMLLHVSLQLRPHQLWNFLCSQNQR